MLTLAAFYAGCFCGGGVPPAPPRASCDAVDTGAMVDSISLDGRHSVGGQGLDMIMFDVTFQGPAPPSCASITFSLTSPVTGAGRGGATVLIETVDSGGAARTREPHWEFWDFGDAIDLTVEAHGQSASAQVCRFSDCGDAGP